MALNTKGNIIGLTPGCITVVRIGLVFQANMTALHESTPGLPALVVVHITANLGGGATGAGRMKKGF